MHCELSSFPLLSEISDDEIKSHIDTDSIPDWNITFKEILVYMQIVERLVKFVMEAPEKNCAAESLDRFMGIPLL